MVTFPRRRELLADGDHVLSLFPPSVPGRGPGEDKELSEWIERGWERQRKERRKRERG